MQNLGCRGRHGITGRRMGVKIDRPNSVDENALLEMASEVPVDFRVRI